MVNIFIFLNSIIAILMNPLGFIIILLVLICLEYFTIRSIVKDPYTLQFKKIAIRAYHRYKLRSTPLNSSQQAIFNTVLHKEAIGVKEISYTTGISPSTTRKIIKDLVSRGYVLQKVNIHDKRAFSYTASQKFGEERRYSA